MSTRLLVRPIGSREGKKNIAEINLAWDYVCAIYSKSQENLSDLTQKFVKFFWNITCMFSSYSFGAY